MKVLSVACQICLIFFFFIIINIKSHLLQGKIIKTFLYQLILSWIVILFYFIFQSQQRIVTVDPVLYNTLNEWECVNKGHRTFWVRGVSLPIPFR